MLLEVRLIDLPVSDALREFTRRRVARALRPFESRIIRVEIRITDENGPDGGIDKRCSATVELAGIKQKVVVQTEGADAYATVQDVCARLGEAVSERWAGELVLIVLAPRRRQQDLHRCPRHLRRQRPPPTQKAILRLPNSTTRDCED